MTSYNSQVGEGRYEIQFVTTNPAYYSKVQEAIRTCMDDGTTEWKKVGQKLGIPAVYNEYKPPEKKNVLKNC